MKALAKFWHQILHTLKKKKTTTIYVGICWKGGREKDVDLKITDGWRNQERQITYLIGFS